MFGETEYDPSRQYTSIPIEEQLEALRRAVDTGKVSHSLFAYYQLALFWKQHLFISDMQVILLLGQVHWSK